MSWFKKQKTPVVDDRMNVLDLLYAAKTTDDPKYAHACLTRAEILAPDSLDVQRALLLHGKLHERDKRAADYAVIKSWLLHAFEHPEQHTEEEQKRMSRELFDEKRLQNCLKMTADPDAFLASYLDGLCDEYMRIFIAGEASHAPRVFGLGSKTMLHKYLANPVSDMIHNIYLSPFLSAQEQAQLARCVYKAFYRYVSGEVKQLDTLLGAELTARLNTP